MVISHAGLGLDLPGPRLDVERRRVGTFKRVGQRVAVWVHGRHRRADVLARRRVLGKAADGISVCEHRRGVVRLSASRRRPVARRLVVQRPHPHLIIGVRPELRDRGAGSGAIVLPGFPVADGALSVFHPIARERRSAVTVRRFPAHQQAGARASRRSHSRRRRGRRLLVHVGDDEGHGDGAAGVLVVSHLHGHRIGRLGLKVVDHAGLGLQLSALGVDVERPCIRACKRVGQRAAAGVRRRHRRPNVLARWRVLGKSAGVGRIRESRRSATATATAAAPTLTHHVDEVDGHGDDVGPAHFVIRLHRHEIGALGLVVVGHAGLGPDLAARVYNGE